MHRNRSLPPNKKGRSTVGFSRAASVVPPSDHASNMREAKPKIMKSNPKSRATMQLIEFLERTEYPNALSHRILQSPNSKEVFCIFEHLVRQIDPTFRIEQRTMKVEEICLNTLRALGYPNTLSKSHLSTPGAPHAWPSVLNAFDWLRQEIEDVNDTFSGDGIFKYNEEQNFDEEPEGKLIHEIRLKSYFAKLEGATLSSGELEEFQRRMNKILGCPSPEDVHQLQTRIRELDEEIASSNNLDVEEENLRTQASEEQIKLEVLAKNKLFLESRMGELQSKYDELLVTASQLESEKAEIEAKLHDVRAQVKKQEEAGYGRLAQEFFMLRGRLESRLQVKKDLVKEVEAMEIDYARREGKIAPALDMYNRLIGALKLPEYTEISNKCNLRVCTYRAGFDITKDLPRIVKAVEACLDRFKTAVSSIEQQQQDISQQISDVESHIDSMEMENVKSDLADTKAQLIKLDELLAEVDASRSNDEREFLQKYSEMSKQLDDAKKGLETAKQQIIELGESLNKEVHERIKLESILKEVERQMAVFIPNLEVSLLVQL